MFKYLLSILISLTMTFSAFSQSPNNSDVSGDINKISKSLEKYMNYYILSNKLYRELSPDKRDIYGKYLHSKATGKLLQLYSKILYSEYHYRPDSTLQFYRTFDDYQIFEYDDSYIVQYIPDYSVETIYKFRRQLKDCMEGKGGLKSEEGRQSNLFWDSLETCRREIFLSQSVQDFSDYHSAVLTSLSQRSMGNRYYNSELGNVLDNIKTIEKLYSKEAEKLALEKRISKGGIDSVKKFSFVEELSFGFLVTGINADMANYVLTVLEVALKYEKDWGARLYLMRSYIFISGEYGSLVS